jgi:Uma2 family endonuclease
MSAAIKLSPGNMTIAEFLAWAEDADGRWQLGDGEPELMSPPAELHGVIQAALVMLLGNHLARHQPTCRVVIGPGVIPRLRSDRNMLVPDIAITCTPPRGDHAVQQPVLLAEILSPSNAKQTRANIWAFTTIPSVAELLVIRSDRIGAEVLRREPDGHWPAQPMLLEDGDTLGLATLEFSAPLRQLCRGTLLDLEG